MALITIYKNNKCLTIPEGAYLSQYAPAGWKLQAHQKNTELSHIDKDLQEGKDEDLQEGKDENKDSEEVELTEKPISEMTVPELRALAELKGIDITGLTSSKKLKEVLSQTD